jgi:4-hydroxy-4-methyl-2-oxoglutarate aldolase
MNESLLARAQTLHPAVVSDVLDRLGHRRQVMAPRIRPLFPEAKLVGYARTVHAEPVDGPPEREEDWYRHQLEAIESMRPGHVMVVSTIEACFWGELLSIASRNMGARGIVLDCYTRDVDGIVQVGFPVFCAGIHSADGLGRVDVVEHGSEINSGGVVVHDGDLLVGALDGVVVVPSEVAEEAVALAEEKLRGENMVRTKLEEGMLASEAWRRYGIL